ncbi:MAG: DUF2378 family protein [Polyangiales bacterium]
MASLYKGPFVVPTFVGDLDVEERVAGAPSGGKVKGMFFSAIADEASAACGSRVGRARYVPFQGYPLSEWIAFLPEAARAAYPSRHPKEGMRRFGHNAFSVFNQSMAGRVILSMAAKNIHASMSLTSRVFQAIGSHGELTSPINEPGRAIVAVRDSWDYIDSWYVGIFEGAIRAFGAKGEVRVRVHDRSNADLEILYSSE